jgi:hypothetical protein
MPSHVATSNVMTEIPHVVVHPDGLRHARRSGPKRHSRQALNPAIVTGSVLRSTRHRWPVSASDGDLARLGRLGNHDLPFTGS